MIRVICNASPVIGLIGINKLNLLWALFDDVLMPEAVYQEICAGNRKSDQQLIQNAIDNKHIRVIQIQGTATVDTLLGRLHRGELETIVGAIEDPETSFAIIDERAARTFAASMLIDTIGILGILRHAKAKGLIENVRTYIDKLVQRVCRCQAICK